MDVIELPASTAQLFATVSLLMLGYVVVELILLLHFRRRRLRLTEARTAALGFFSVAGTAVLIGRFWGTFGVAWMATMGASLSPLDSLGLGPVGWVYGWLVYEFWYWVQHSAAHKVRLLWCIHSPHHAPQSLHMLIGTNHHFVESVFYMPFFAGFMTAICGVDPLVCLGLNFVDSIWGSFLHISDEIVPRGRYGALERVLQTPSHHRVHHAKNVRYLDRNYCSITLLWDWVFGTLQPLREEEAPEYGITREVDTASFWDVHFREFVLLFRDMKSARNGREALGFLLRPPGWRPGDDSQTASARQRALRLATEGGETP